MYSGKFVFAQVMEHIPMKVFHRCVQTYNGDHKVHSLHLPRPVSLHGFCSVDVSGKPQRDRDLPASTKQQALSYGNTWWHCPQYTLQCQQGARLENIRRLRSSIDKDRQAIVRRRNLGLGTRQYGLRSRFIYHRPVPISFSLGSISFHQISCKTSHIARFARQYPNVYPHFSWKNARCEDIGHTNARSRCFLHYGSRLSAIFRVVAHFPTQPIILLFVGSAQPHHKAANFGFGQTTD